MLDWTTSIVESLGAPGVALLMFLENVFPPVPSEVIMPLAGYVSMRSDGTFWLVVAAGSIGSLAGAIGWYMVGRAIGEERLRRWVDAHGRWIAMTCDDLDRVERWFRNHGASSVLIGRLIPGLRTYISIPAGIQGMPAPKFVLYSTIGTVIWTAALAWAGRLLGSAYERVGDYVGPVSSVVFAAFLVFYVFRVVQIGRAERAARS